MSVTDKTIFQCPVYTLYTQLDGGQRMVIQPSSGAAQDYGVPLSLLQQWLFSNYAIGISGGAANPDPAAGNNGDIYFQTNGQIWQKVGGSWVIKAAFPINGAQITSQVTQGVTGLTVTIPHTGMVYPQVQMYEPDGTEYTGATWADDGTNIIVSCPDGGGSKSADTFLIVVSGSVGGSGGSGSSLSPINKTDADLLVDGGGSWYLELSLSSGVRPFYTESNGVQITGAYFDITYTPNRLYGFANNDSQNILIKVA